MEATTDVNPYLSSVCCLNRSCCKHRTPRITQLQQQPDDLYSRFIHTRECDHDYLRIESSSATRGSGEPDYLQVISDKEAEIFSTVSACQQATTSYTTHTDHQHQSAEDDPSYSAIPSAEEDLASSEIPATTQSRLPPVLTTSDSERFKKHIITFVSISFIVVVNVIVLVGLFHNGSTSQAEMKLLTTLRITNQMLSNTTLNFMTTKRTTNAAFISTQDESRPTTGSILIRIGVDDRGKAYIDGKLLTDNLEVYYPQKFNISRLSRSIGVHVTNKIFVIGLLVVIPGVLDRTWKCTKENQKDLAWTTAGFNDSSWPNAVSITQNGAWNAPRSHTFQFAANRWWFGVKDSYALSMFCRRLI